MRATETADVLSAISRAGERAAGSSASGSSTRPTRPPAAAPSAENPRPVYVHSAACATPTSRGGTCLLARWGTRPGLANERPIFAVLAERRTSIGSVSVMPKPTAGPLMAAITGFFISKMRSVTSPPPSRCSSGVAPRPSNVVPPPPRSAPAQNARPAPVTITTRTPSSASARSNAATSSRMTVALTAFSRSGRLSVSVAIPSATSYSSVSKLMRRSKAQRPDVLARGGDGGLRRGGRLDLEPLELRHDFLREEPHVALGLLVRHPGVGEGGDIVAVAGAAMDAEDLLVALRGRARDLKVHEVVDDGVGAVLRDLLAHLAVVLVALRLREMVALEVIVIEHRLVVAADVAARHLARALGVGVAEGPPRRDGRRRLRAVDLAVDGAVRIQLLGHFVPRLLRDDQDPDAQARHDRQRVRRDGRRVGAAAERLERRGPDGRARLLHERAVVLAVAVLESLQQHLRGFDEALAGFVHRHAEAVELHLAGAAAEAEDQPAVGDVVEHRDFLGHAHRVVPRQHDHHRAELRLLRAAGHVGEELQHVGAHRVVGEMVLDTPYRLVAERLREIGQPQFVAIDLTIRAALLRILEHGRHSDVHAGLLAATERLRPVPPSVAPGHPARQCAGRGYNGPDETPRAHRARGDAARRAAGAPGHAGGGAAPRHGRLRPRRRPAIRDHLRGAPRHAGVRVRSSRGRLISAARPAWRRRRGRAARPRRRRGPGRRARPGATCSRAARGPRSTSASRAASAARA